MGRFSFAVRMWIAVVLFVLGPGLYKGFSVTITITATGDNYLYYYNWERGSWEKLNNDDYDSWKRSASVRIKSSGGYDYLVFAVKNKGNGSNGNGSGLLAQIDISNRIRIFSDDSWQVSPVSEGWDKMPQFDVVNYRSYSWNKAEWYAYNNGEINPNHSEADGRDCDGKSFWYEENGSKPISGIDLTAKWIWTGKNFSSEMDKGALFLVRIPPVDNKSSNSVVAEPNTIALLLFGLLVSIVGTGKIN